MRSVAGLVLATIVLAAGMGGAQAPPARLALVIGNADYDLNGDVDASPSAAALARQDGLAPDLANPVNDARDIRDTLAGLGFDVSTYDEDASRQEMVDLLESFGRKVRQASPDAVVMVFYSGHGFQVDGVNFLLPAGGKLIGMDYASTPAVEVHAALSQVAVPMDFVRSQLSARSGAGANIVILDACRNNPWDPRGEGPALASYVRGFSQVSWGLDQTLVVYSTEPGQFAYDDGGNQRNSPFTAALKRQLATPDLGALSMFNAVARSVSEQTRSREKGAQIPWINVVSMPEICLGGCTPRSFDPQAAAELERARRRIAELEARAAGPTGMITLTARPEVRKLSISWVAVAEGGNPEYVRIAQYAMNTIQGDLEQTGRFRIAGVPDASLRAINVLPSFDDLVGRADFALIMNAKPTPDGRLTIEYRLYDVPQRQQKIGLSLTTTPDNFRRVAHRIADAIYSSASPGASSFDSRLLVTQRQGASSRMMIMDADGANPSYLLPAGEYASPRFDPTGTQIFYLQTSVPNGVSVKSFDLATASTAAHYASGSLVAEAGFDVARRGALMAVVERDEWGDQDVVLVDRNSGQVARRVTMAGDQIEPSFAPDGVRIALISRAGGETRLMTGDPANGMVPVGPVGDYTGVTWSPRRDELAFVRRSARGDFVLGTVDIATGQEKLHSTDVRFGRPAWSPSGTFVVAYRHGVRALETVETETGAGRRIPVRMRGESVDWSPVLR